MRLRQQQRSQQQARRRPHLNRQMKSGALASSYGTCAEAAAGEKEGCHAISSAYSARSSISSAARRHAVGGAWEERETMPPLAPQHCSVDAGGAARVAHIQHSTPRHTPLESKPSSATHPRTPAPPCCGTGRAWSAARPGGTGAAAAAPPRCWGQTWPGTPRTDLAPPASKDDWVQVGKMTRQQGLQCWGQTWPGTPRTGPAPPACTVTRQGREAGSTCSR